MDFRHLHRFQNRSSTFGQSALCRVNTVTVGVLGLISFVMHSAYVFSDYLAIRVYLYVGALFSINVIINMIH
jgi:hypothetical protein